MAIVHIVLVQFKSSLDAAAILDTCNRFLDLKTKAIHAKTGQPYIQNITGGRNNSPEGLHDGLTHAFTVILGSDEDRDFYLKDDQEHIAFGQHLKSVSEKVVVIDYEPESF